MKVTNLGKNPVTIYCGGVSMAASHGESIESDNFTDAELKQYRAYPEAFEVEGEAKEPVAGDPELLAFHNSLAPVAERLHANRETFVETVTAELDVGDKARVTLAEIVALFGTDEVDELNVKAAVERLIQDAGNKANADAINGNTGDGPFEPLTLAAAIQALDDANDDHWTQAGHPDISTLKSLTGGDVTRAMVDQLPADQKRERVKPSA